MRTAFIFCENKDHSLKNHPERPERITFPRKMIAAKFPKIPIIKMKDYTEDEVIDFLSTTHNKSHLQKLKYKFHVDSAYSVGMKSYLAVLDLTRCIMTMCELVLDDKIDCAMLVVRPPGHHCCNHRPAGFCLINTAVVAAKTLLKKYNKVNIFDIDLHHGGGTQYLVQNNKNISYSSIHNKNVWSDGLFPKGINGIIRDGRIINVALNGQSDDSDYKYTTDHIIKKIKPFSDCVVLSAGFDAHKEERGYVGENLSHLMDISSEYYGYLGNQLSENFKNIFFILEGGYNEVAIASSIVCFLDAVQGKKFHITDNPCHYTVRNIQKNF